MADVDKSAVTQTENVVDKPRRRGCMGHCARFWWAYVILVIVIVVVVVPVVLLVAVPKIAQQKIDEAELILTRLTVTNTQATNFTMSIESNIKTDGSVHAVIDAFEGVMYLEDTEDHTPFAKVNFPQTTSDAFQTVHVSQFMHIDDISSLTVFNTWLLANDSVRVTLLGETNVRVKGISRAYPVNFKKTIAIPGLQMLDGTSVNQTTISITNDERGNNFWGTTYIPNRSPVAFELGNVTFHNYLEDAEIGTIYIDNLALEPGMNEFKLRGSVEQLPILTAMTSRPYCDETKGVLPLKIRAKSVINHGQSLKYFSDALGAYNQTVPIDVLTPLKKTIEGYELKCKK